MGVRIRVAPCLERSGCSQRSWSPFWNGPGEAPFIASVLWPKHTKSQFQIHCLSQKLRSPLSSISWSAIYEIPSAKKDLHWNNLGNQHWASVDVALSTSARAAGRAPGSVPSTPFTARACCCDGQPMGRMGPLTLIYTGDDERDCRDITSPFGSFNPCFQDDGAGFSAQS